MNRYTRWVVAAVCAYEAAAIVSCGKIPTITALQHRHRTLAYLIVGALAWHFLRYEDAELKMAQAGCHALD